MSTGRVEDMLTHPAVRAWQAVDARRGIPAGVELMRERRSQTIFRLVGAGPGASEVIGKRCLRATAALERRVYERILPRLPVSAPNYYGYVDDGEEFAWIFLEDVGAERMTLANDAQRKVAARWLGTLHASAVDVAGPDDLPDRGSDHFRRVLGRGKASIAAGMDNPVLRPDQRRTIEAVLRVLAVVEAEWDAIEGFFRALPRTLVHGDFQPKNVLVRAERTDVGLFPIDWEFSGWGPAVLDLAPASGGALEPQVDLAAYVSVARKRWPDSNVAALRDQVVATGILRRLAAIEWAAQNLGYPNPLSPVAQVLKPVAQLENYVTELLEALGNAPWRRGRDR